jgi:hypothetical protein
MSLYKEPVTETLRNLAEGELSIVEVACETP